jgi:hypothetical protein
MRDLVGRGFMLVAALGPAAGAIRDSTTGLEPSPDDSSVPSDEGHEH